MMTAKDKTDPDPFVVWLEWLRTRLRNAVVNVIPWTLVVLAILMLFAGVVLCVWTETTIPVWGKLFILAGATLVLSGIVAIASSDI